MKPLILLLTFLTSFVLTATSWAHKPSDSYLLIQTQSDQVAVQWDLSLIDLHLLVGLDNNQDQRITWQEFQQKRPQIEAYALQHLTLSTATQTCELMPEDWQITEHAGERYAAFHLSTDCPSNLALNVSYDFLFEFDADHRGLLFDQRDMNAPPLLFSPDTKQHTLHQHTHSLRTVFWQYLWEGMWHIWIGLDHILFVLSLLLAAVLVYRQGAWQPQEDFKSAAWQLTKVVTAFTLAHSITLSIAIFDVIQLPSRLVESIIALSVLLVALNHFKPIVTKRLWLVAFGFGLIHGFGFASVLGDLGLSAAALGLSVLAFNLGVEIGQLAILALAFPIAFAIRNTAFYQKGIFLSGSAVIGAIAAYWFMERALGW